MALCEIPALAWDVGHLKSVPHSLRCGLEIGASIAQIGVRARAQFSEPGPEFCELHPGAAPCKITTKRKSHLEPPAIEIVEVSPTSTAIQPPRWPTPAPRSRCARASSSATLCSAASRWSCESSSQFPALPAPTLVRPQQLARRICDRVEAISMGSARENADAFDEVAGEMGSLDLGRWTWWLTDHALAHSDVLHPNRANISKEELRDKLAGLYKAQKDQVSVFGLRTQFGGGKTTGFALVYDSPEAMKKFEPHYRLVRVGLATKIEKASRQQRTFPPTMQAVSDSTTAAFGRLGMAMADPPPAPQASSARTGRRPCGVRRRSRAPSPRRRNRRLAFLFGVVCYTGYLGGWDVAVALCITLDCLLHPANLTPETCNWT